MMLTKDEQAIFDGESGEANQKAMEILAALGKIYGAESLVPVSSVQVAGVSYKNLGEAGRDFIAWWSEHGAKVRSFSTLNPAGIDLKRWKQLGFSKDFSERQKEVVSLYESLGIVPTCTCAPYEIGNTPKFGDHIAWSESSAVSFANSYMGARTNREGGPSALAAAIIGKTPCYGYHLDKNRGPSISFDVKADVASEADFGALGFAAGAHAKDAVPLFYGLRPMRQTHFKQLGAAMAASGAVALYHVEKQTPDIRCRGCGEALEKICIESLDDAYSRLNTGGDKVDFVSLGCPHASLEEIREIAGHLKGKRVSVPTWITTSIGTRALSDAYGYLKAIESTGARVVTDTCMVVSPIEEFGYGTVAANSAKGCYYMQSWCGVETRFGDVHQCLDAAISGSWRK